MSHLQGPALLAYNDTTFSDADWEAIRTVSQSSKTTDTERIGKHGLGSRAYYHLTDNPQYLSGGYLVTFDPHRWMFEDGGWRETLQDVASCYSDQLAPFSAITGEAPGEYFPGTIVRLPLRSTSANSRISSDRLSVGKIRKLLIDFAQTELHMVMLFLTHLSSIEIREIDRHGQVTVLAIATASSRPCGAPVHSDPSAIFGLETREISVSSYSTVRSGFTDSREWVVVRTSFPVDECVDRLSAVFANDSERVQRELGREKLRPDIALAFPKSASHAASLTGRLFTFLPLPLETGFPCHIHGIFSLTDSRQNLRNPSETILAETADALAVAWNELLFSTFIPRAWLVLLESVASGSIPLSMYNILPPLQNRNASGDAKYWTSLLHNLVELALERDASIWPQLLLSSLAAPVNYTSLSMSLIAAEHDSAEQLRALIKGGVVIILPPAHIRLVLLEREPQSELKPGAARARLVASASLAKLQRAEYNHIIEFLLQSQELDHLMDVPIIPLVTGNTAALVAKRNAPVKRVLMTAEDEELFGQFDPHAVALQHLPPVAQRLLIRQGRDCLNVVSLDCAKASEYTRTVCQHFSTARPYTSSWFGTTWNWTKACEWLGVFWEWIATCSFAQELLAKAQSLPLLPTIANELRAIGETVFFYPDAMDDSTIQVLCRLGISFLLSSIPPAFFQQHRPALLKSATSASDLLPVLRSTPVALFDEDSARILRTHLSNCFIMSTRLTVSQKSILRGLPIHPVVTHDPHSDSVQVRPSSLPSLPIYCLANPCSLPLPLPRLTSALFVHRSDDEQRLLEQIDHQTSVNVITDKRLLQLHVEHIEQQSPSARLRVLQFLVKNAVYGTSEIMDKLRTSRIVPVRVGDDLLPPQDVINPWSSISELVPPGDRNALCDVNSETSKALVQLGLLRSELDLKFVEDRIRYISSLPTSSSADKALASDAAKRLLRVLDSDTSGFNCSRVQYDPQLAWIPTTAGLQKPQDTRDGAYRILCDRVMHMLDIQTPIESRSLRRMLRWDQPIPCDILIEQLRRLVPDSKASPEYIVRLTREFGRRFYDLSQTHLDQLVSLLSSVPCVRTEGDTLREPRFAVFRLTTSRPRGFGQISLDLVEEAGMFLRRIGCTEIPSNTAILQQLELLAQASVKTPSANDASACINLLESLDFDSITEQDRSSLVVPANDNSLRGVNELFYNNLGSRASRFAVPENRVRVHQNVRSTLRSNLQIPSLGSLHCAPLSFLAEDMREDLTTRIANVLRSYAVEQAFNEFLANAADAGATSFDLMLDDAETRQVKFREVSELLCEGIAQFCRGTSLIVHNDALFTEDDIRGICRIGRGGKEGRIDSIGKFGLGALSFYHFSEVAMILSGKYLVLLDPSGRSLPEDLNANSWVAPLDQVRSLYPKQLQVFSGLFGFQINDAEYGGTIIRLPLRTAKQASEPSSLSKVSLEAWSVCEMLERHKSLAAQSLFFIPVNRITASASAVALPLWTVSANRVEVPSENEPYSVQNVDITVSERNIIYSNSHATSWSTFVYVIPSASYPPWVPEVLEKHRMKQVRIALASEHGVDSDCSAAKAKTHRATQKLFFTSLPLPIMTTLPVHVNASFVLADDRRSIRWDGDGTLNRDSEFNHWLLSSMIPPLYLFLLEVWHRSLPKSLAPWPGHGNDPPDTLSRTVVDGFYSDCLSRSTRPVCRTITGRCIIPSSAVLHSASDPLAIRIVLRFLKPDDLVKLPSDVRIRVLALPGMRRVDSSYISTVISQQEPRFLEVYRSGELGVHHLKDIIKFLLPLGDSPTETTARSAEVLAGLPLLPLADESLARIKAEGEAASVVFTGAWEQSVQEGTPYPWPVFPARRFLHPSLDQELLLERGLNVKRLEGSDVVSLLQDVIAPAARRDVTATERAWILSFWSLYPKLPNRPKLDQLSQFPLIPTASDLIFFSLNNAIALPTIGYPEARARDDCSIITPLQKLGAEFVLERLQVTSSWNTAGHLALPFEVRCHLSVVAFTFKRVLAIFQHLFDTYGQDFVHRRFDALCDGERKQLASWVRHNLGTWQDDRTGGSDSNAEVDIVPHLPIWTAYPSVSGSPTLLSLTDTFVRILPMGITLTHVILYLGKNPSLHFVEYSTEMSKLVNVNPMSFDDFVRLLKFAPYFRNVDSIGRYKLLLNCVLRYAFDRPVPGLAVPNEGLELVDISTVYKSNVPEFQAAFAHRLNQNFVHSLLRTYEDRMVALGLRVDLDCSSFLTCVQAMDEDFDKESLEDCERSRVIFAWYSTQLPLKAEGNDAWWRSLDAYSFIPRHASRRIGSLTTFEASEFSVPLPCIVSPNRILLHEHSSVCWTQRALFPEQSSVIRRLVMADESIGVPTVEEVVKHLRVLALKIAPRYPKDSGLLEDLEATYKFLNDRDADAAPYLLRQRREKLFLNVDDPTRDGWHFCAASQIMFNVPDEDGREDVRVFLRPFRNLLFAGGAEEIKVPMAPVLVQSPAEDELARMRASLDGLRQSKILTDVVFTLEERSEDTAEFHAHRVILSTASEHFHTMFCGQLAESGPASAEHPITVRLQDDLELQCARLIVDHVYTGHFEQRQGRDCLLKLMQLAHRWAMPDVQREAEVLLIPTITPGTFLELLDYAKLVEATLLQEKVAEFERENALALEQMIERD
ncbi:hypothetical protein C8Q80DRAFT_1274667 [Daedaleopsis nitida]|nr:hypothetical protein C8Q80DRAFT_1274667 [Daedaleopsis nitida]